jgi:hypothetical protein
MNSLIRSERLIRLLRPLSLAVGLIMVLAGLLRDEARFVWLRAIQICLGCIGIG